MHMVVNRLRLTRPIAEEVFAQAQLELPPRAAQIPGLQAFHVLRIGERELVVRVQGDNVDAIEQMRAQIGDAWMRENVVSHLDGPTERMLGEAVVSFERAT